MAARSKHPIKSATSTTDEAELLIASLEDDIEVTLHRHRALKLQDIAWRLDNREKFRKYLMRLLVGQNIATFALVTVALYFDKLQHLQPVFSVLIGATLAETASMIFFIIKWLFSEIPYEKNPADVTLHNEGQE